MAMTTYQSRIDPSQTCQAEPYDYCGQKRYRIRFLRSDREYDLDGRTFEEGWEMQLKG